MNEQIFKFDLYQHVYTPVSEGVVTVKAVDAGGVCYYIQGAAASDWWKEEQLKPQQEVTQ